MVKRSKAHPATRGRRSTVELAWKTNHIAEHRDGKHMTQQAMSDALRERGIELTRNSIGRIEQGKQRPFADVLEAMADILDVDVHSMINLTPEEAESVGKFRRLSAKDQRRALRHMEVGDGD